MVRLTRIVVLLALLSACQSTMSLEEAKKVTALFRGASFVPPPRTINDITAILDQQKRAYTLAAAEARARADQSPPATTDPAALADFYYQRGRAAGQIGRARQKIEDLTKAASYAGSLPGGIVTLQMRPELGDLLGDVRRATAGLEILFQLAGAEMQHGNLSRGVELSRTIMSKLPLPDLEGWLIAWNSELAVNLALFGDLNAAEAALKECLAVFYRAVNVPGQHPIWVARWHAYTAQAQGTVAAVKGRLHEAEKHSRRAVEALEGYPLYARSWWLDDRRVALALILVRQGRLLEAENEARRALLSVLSRLGRYSPQTASILRGLISVLFAQSRYAESEALARAAVEIYEKTGSAPESVWLAHARQDLAAALVAQGRWQEALAEYEAIRVGLAEEPQSYRRFLNSHAGLVGQVGWALALLKTGRVDRALEILPAALERTARLVGQNHRNTAEIRGLLAMAYAAKGDHARALREFTRATPLLLTGAQDVDDESGSRAAQDQRAILILESYVALLAEARGTALEQEAGVDAAAEAFRLVEVARGRSVQRALDASAARAAAKTPALAELVRREQDAAKQLSALRGALANALSVPTDQQNPKAVETLQSQIETLHRAREALAQQIAKEFPAYTQLINPSPATLEQARARLKPDEALITTYVTADRTFVWAVPQNGPVAFATVRIDAKALEADIANLRRALDPSAKRLGEIPEFDLAIAHRLYDALLAPVAEGWQRAQSLVVVPHGPLGHLPLSLLPTRATRLGPEDGVRFANYRAVPWLVRSHAVTMLPSLTALVTVRSLPPGDARRRPFVGFGDPHFSQEQAQRAARQRLVDVAAVTSRNLPITLRDLKVQSLDSARLGILPGLPDTAEEIRSIAATLNADVARDVFLGERANEHVVKTLDLSIYRIIAFATHGLVPGDLDGLTQPALALTAPEVAKVDGDGLLTVEEILGLRLNADWVVLSACNTASGRGAGSEAISGLGRAFFYAGARALLVSNWPVETTSARTLTTELFRRQGAQPELSRAKALQQTMNALIDGLEFVDPATNTVVFSYAHPIFWAPFTLVGDGG